MRNASITVLSLKLVNPDKSVLSDLMQIRIRNTAWQYSFTNQEGKILIGWGAQRQCMHNARMGRAATMHA
jgi:hypothetical protein